MKEIDSRLNQERADTYKKKYSLSPEQHEDLWKNGEDLWYSADREIRIFHPANPPMPVTEGTYVCVESRNFPLHPQNRKEMQQWLFHQETVLNIGQILSTSLSKTQDMWQSFVGQTDYSPTNYLTTQIYGRNPLGKNWTRNGMTSVPLPEPDYDYRDARLSDEQLYHLYYLFDHHLPREQYDTQPIFPKQPTVYLPRTPEFQKEAEAKPWSHPMLVTDMFSVLLLYHPHVRSGIHLMVDAPEKLNRPWEDIPKALQMLAVAEIVAQFLEENNIASWTSMRATGSFYAGFKKLFNDPLFYEYFDKDPKLLKLEYESKWLDMFFHPHVYGAKYSDEGIHTISTVEQKGMYPELPEKERDEMRGVLQENVISRLIERTG